MLYLSKPYCVAIFVVFFSVYLFFGSIPLLQLACQLFQFIYSDPSYKIVPTLSDKSLCICLSQIVFLFSFRVFFSSFFFVGGEGGGGVGEGLGWPFACFNSYANSFLGTLAQIGGQYLLITCYELIKKILLIM